MSANTSNALVDDVIDIMNKSDLPSRESLTIPTRAGEYLPIPAGLCDALRAALAAKYPNGLYSHQSEAIEAVLIGNDVCLSTQTASGKSLVFMAAATELVFRNRSARVLAIYPAKALIQDQLEKWRQFTENFNIQVGFIDGSVPMTSRSAILTSCQIIAITPDVAHAWLMSHLAADEVRRFLQNMELLVLDEAHIYDGAFGTNMAYFLRRLSLPARGYRLICSTATIGDPEQLMLQLTGRSMRVFDAMTDGSPLNTKTLMLTELRAKGSFDRTVSLLTNLASYGRAKFIAFGDSRRAVELIVGAILRRKTSTQTSTDDGDFEGAPVDQEMRDWPKLEHILPFRAGYEAEDRQAIQRALSEGTLAGVVSTSALELGLDIGDLDIVILLNTPPSTKSFKQRIGRAGRRRPSVCILVDDLGIMSPLQQYVCRESEPNWLYLENRYIQYANALCATVELQARGIASTAGLDYAGLPESFRRHIDNELSPVEAVPQDLYPLKQRAQGNPHYEFPIRSAAEQSFDVEGPLERKLGTLTYGQVLREGYPGAVYYYMARPFRIQSLEYKNGVIRAATSKYATTKPLAETMAFPDFKNGIIGSWNSDDGFVAEVEIQVNERVSGFVEQHGQHESPPHQYGPGSPYSQKPLSRLFRTTGVCWSFRRNPDLSRSKELADCLMRAFSLSCGVQVRDLGLAFFHANEGPFSADTVKGTVIFDATNGSLRLTERLARQFSSIITCAIEQTGGENRSDLEKLRELVDALRPHSAVNMPEPVATESDWVRVIGRDQRAIYLSGEGPLEVDVLDFRYTPKGIMYQLKPLEGPGYSVQVERNRHGAVKTINKNSAMTWMVLASHIQPLLGNTRMIRYNVITGDEVSDGESDRPCV